MTIGKRIKGYRTSNGLKVKEFSEKIGISQGTLSDIENGKTKPSADTLSLIIRHTDINPNWLLTGHGAFTREPLASYHGRPVLKPIPKAAQQKPGGKELSLREATYGEEFARVPVFTLAGARMPKEFSEYEPVETITLPADFSGPGIVTVKVRGRSMEPAIWDGAVAGVNTMVQNIVSGDIYAFWLPYEGAVIKRVFVGYEKLILRSDNPNFPPIELPRKELEADAGTYRFLGRVDWIIQKREN